MIVKCAWGKVRDLSYFPYGKEGFAEVEREKFTGLVSRACWHMAVLCG